MSEEKNSNRETEKTLSDLQKRYGADVVGLGSKRYPFRIIPTGCLALDYATGVGGWPTRNIIGIFGPRDIGKSVLALMAIANAQKMGMNCVWIAVEPNFDATWAEKHGVDPDKMIVAYPKNAEMAFDMMKAAVYSGSDLVVFDSIGAVSSASEMEEGGKSRVGGSAALISHAIKAISPAVFANDVCVIVLNQIRDRIGSPVPGAVSQPGGHNLEHLQRLIVQLKRGSEKINAKINGDDVQIAHEVVAVMKKNKIAEGSEQKARFMFYNMQLEDYPFGVDWVEDLIATGKRTGVIGQAGAYYMYGDNKFQGKKALGEFLITNPDVRDEIREKILESLRGPKGE